MSTVLRPDRFRSNVVDPWFDLPPGYGVGEDGIDLRPGSLLMAVEKFAGDRLGGGVPAGRLARVPNRH